jgi:hypothetical protein
MWTTSRTMSLVLMIPSLDTLNHPLFLPVSSFSSPHESSCPPSIIPSHSVYSLGPGTMHHQSKIHSSSVVPRSHRLPKGRLLYQDPSSVRFFTSLQPFQRDLYPSQMNDERKPRAICRNFIYQGVCDNMQCPRAHVPYQNMVRSVVTHAPILFIINVLS